MASAAFERLRAGWRAARAHGSRLLAHLPGPLQRKRSWLALLGALAILGIGARIVRPPVDRALTTLVRRGELVVQVSAAGILKPASSITYRSPLAGREAEITVLAPEGVLVNEGDLVARLDTTDLQADLLRALQDARQAEVELKVAEVERLSLIHI